jgi:hypothetical protein
LQAPTVGDGNEANGSVVGAAPVVGAGVALPPPLITSPPTIEIADAVTVDAPDTVTASLLLESTAIPQPFNATVAPLVA